MVLLFLTTKTETLLSEQLKLKSNTVVLSHFQCLCFDLSELLEGGVSVKGQGRASTHWSLAQRPLLAVCVCVCGLAAPSVVRRVSLCNTHLPRPCVMNPCADLSPKDPVHSSVTPLAVAGCS